MLVGWRSRGGSGQETAVGGQLSSKIGAELVDGGQRSLEISDQGSG